MKEQIDKNIASCFMLDPDVTYLNHGSFGACPEPIFNSLIKWQKKVAESKTTKNSWTFKFDARYLRNEARYGLGDCAAGSTRIPRLNEFSIFRSIGISVS